MESNEFALVIFTILTQMCVGMFCMSTVLPFFVSHDDQGEVQRINDSIPFYIAPVMIGGMIVSLLHLGTPANCFHAIRNIGSSPLSREIALTGLFTGLICLLVFMRLKKIASKALYLVVSLLAVLAGLLLIYSMAQVYMLRTVPVWNSTFTLIQFFTTGFLLGTLALGSVYVFYFKKLKKDDLHQMVRLTVTITIIMLGIELAAIPLGLAGLAAGSETGLSSLKIMGENNGGILLIRLILVFVGACLAGFFSYRDTFTEKWGPGAGGFYLAFALVFMAEIIGRALFYASYARVGLLN